MGHKCHICGKGVISNYYLDKKGYTCYLCAKIIANNKSHNVDECEGMTEKRFKVAVYDEKAINGFTVLDLHKPNSSKRLKYENVYIGSKEGCDIVCKFGNELADENEQLKKAYNDAKSDVEKYEQILKDIMKDNLLIQDAKRS